MAKKTVEYFESADGKRFIESSENIPASCYAFAQVGTLKPLVDHFHGRMGWKIGF